MNLVAAFFAGIATFFTPCVFPLIPSYLSLITGLSLDELSKGDRDKVLKKTITSSLFFIFGFSVIFVALGIAASMAGSLVIGFQSYLRIIGGILIVFFGLVLIGAINLKVLNIEKRFQLKGKPVGLLGAFIFGMTFAAGWVPCVGPVLSSVLVLASSEGSRFYGGVLLLFYCIGLGLPVMISGILFNSFLSAYKKAVKYIRVIELVSGALLIIIGILLIMDNMTAITILFEGIFNRK